MVHEQREDGEISVIKIGKYVPMWLWGVHPNHDDWLLQAARDTFSELLVHVCVVLTFGSFDSNGYLRLKNVMVEKNTVIMKQATEIFEGRFCH